MTFSFVKKTFILLILIVSLAVNVSAQFLPVDGEIVDYAANIYNAARADFGRSFNGYCGTYIRCQLKAIGIFDGQYDFHANGNQWYDVFDGVCVTSGGYSVLRESGSDCLDKLAKKYGNNLSNIVVSFPVQANYSARYPGAGHAVLIHKLVDGVAYYSESFSFGEFREGQVIAEDIDSLMKRYQRNHGQARGCVYFSENDKGYVALSNGFMRTSDILYEDDIIAKMMETLNSSVLNWYII